jgi:hypothetical protein
MSNHFKFQNHLQFQNLQNTQNIVHCLTSKKRKRTLLLLLRVMLRRSNFVAVAGSGDPAGGRRLGRVIARRPGGSFSCAGARVMTGARDLAEPATLHDDGWWRFGQQQRLGSCDRCGGVDGRRRAEAAVAAVDAISEPPPNRGRADFFMRPAKIRAHFRGLLDCDFGARLLYFHLRAHFEVLLEML